eukprot:scaffold175_cov150-Isochrysis_galbana.AAC.9
MLLRLRVTKIKKLHILQNLRCELSFAVPGSEANLCYMFGGLGICEAKCASSKRLNNDSIFTSHKFTHKAPATLVQRATAGLGGKGGCARAELRTLPPSNSQTPRAPLSPSTPLPLAPRYGGGT